MNADFSESPRELRRLQLFSVAGGSARHSHVILNLARQIGDDLDDTPCQFFAEDMRVQIAEGVLYPDVMMICGKAEAGDEQTVTGTKRIIEVLSPCTGGYDKRDQFIPYITLESLRDHVLIDPAKRQVEAFPPTHGGSWSTRNWPYTEKKPWFRGADSIEQPADNKQ